ncbi:MAG: serine/threonine-protein kinase [Pseudomonadota bacterium]
MEYVEGIPIDEYCRAHELTTVAKLQLFLNVCSAITYAHQNLIIHRDIKPANILISKKGAVKLLDFGVAKLTESQGRETRTLDVMMTPNFASPEQFRREALSTTSDVYALGILLYKLVTESLPYTLEDTGPSVVERRICDEMPPPPSAVSTVSSRDIDAIVMKALRKEPERRYATVNELSADIQRYLDGYPVKAAPDSLSYRSIKFLRRNKGRLLATGSATFALLIALGIALNSRQEALTAQLIAKQKSEVTQQAAQFLGSVFSKASPFRHGGAVPSVQALLESSISDIDNAFATEPVLQAMLYTEVAVAMAELSMTEEAQRTAGRALKALERPSDGDVDYPSVRLQTLLRLSGMPWVITDFGQAMDMIDKARATALSQPSPDPFQLALIELRQSRLEYEWDRPDAGLAAVERVLAHAPLEIDAPAVFAEALSHKGKIIAARHRDVESGLALMRRALEVKTTALGELHPSILWELDNYATHIQRVPENALEIANIAERQQRIIDHNFGGDSVWSAFPLWTRGAAAAASGDWASAETSFDKFVSIGLEQGYSGMFLVYSSRDSGWSALKQRKFMKAEQDFQRMLDYAQAAFGTSHWAISDAHLYLSVLKRLQGDNASSYEHLGASLANIDRYFDGHERSDVEFAYLRESAQALAMISEHNAQF